MAQSAPGAFGQAGVTPAEIDIAMIYDSFSITVLALLEDLGFCAKGEGGAFLDPARFALVAHSRMADLPPPIACWLRSCSGRAPWQCSCCWHGPTVAPLHAMLRWCLRCWPL